MSTSSNNTSNLLLEEALAYARRGWFVFPVRERPEKYTNSKGELVELKEKTPYISHGLNDASIDEDQIRAWWGMWKDALIGINAGKSNLFVVDIDVKHINGHDTYDKWGIDDSGAFKSRTPSGGEHIIFSGTGKTDTNAKTGIDTRSIGGYFIAPPSKVIEGEFTGKYEKVNDWEGKPAPIPDGLLKKLFSEVKNGGSYTSDGTKKNPSNRTVDFLLNGALEGERNKRLFAAAADLAGCGYSEDETRAHLIPVVDRIGLPHSELEASIKSAYSKPRIPSIAYYEPVDNLDVLGKQEPRSDNSEMLEQRNSSATKSRITRKTSWTVAELLKTDFPELNGLCQALFRKD